MGFYYFCSMKNIILFLALLGAGLLLSCNGGTNKNEGGDDSPRFIILDSIDVPDIAEVVGYVGDGTSMNVIELVTEGGDSLYIETSNGVVMGGLMSGEMLDVTYNSHDGANRAMTCVNLSALLHVWAQPSLTGAKQCLELNEGGRASTYGMSVEYDSWSLKDGRLLLYSPKKIASEAPAQVDTFDIMQLDDEHMVLMHGDLESEFLRDN